MKFSKIVTILSIWMFSIAITSQEKSSCFQLISGTLRNKISNKIIPKVPVELLSKNKLIKTVITDSNGKFNFKVNCDVSYYISVNEPNFKVAKKNLKTSDASNIRVEVTLYTTPLKMCTEIFNGKVIDEFTKEPIKNVLVEIRDKNNNLISSETTNTHGNYHFNLECKQQYIATFKKMGYINAITNFKTSTNNKKIQRRDLVLHRQTCNSIILGTVINSKTDKPIENATVAIFKEDVEIKKIHTNQYGVFKTSVKCNTKYTIKSWAKNFRTNSISISTTSNEKPVNAVLKLVENLKDKKAPTKLVDTITKPFKIPTLNPFKFELNSSEIKKDIALELNKVAKIMAHKPNTKVQINSHTDNRGPEPYNLSLTEARARKMVAFLINKGIKTDRILGKGYGGTKLKINCTKEKKCTESEHQQNKRIEIIFL